MKPHGASARERRDALCGRLQVLDAFRAVAIFSVIAFHYLWCWAPPAYPHNLYGYGRVYSHWLSLGTLGVQFFFMISGFVILMTLESCRTLPEFWFRRFARLYPAYVLVMLASYAITHFFGPLELRSTATDLLAGFVFMPPDLAGGTFVDLAFWSLLVEGQFYLSVGLIFMAARQRFVPLWILFVSAGLAGWLLGAANGWQALQWLGNPLSLLPHATYFTAGMAFYQQYRQRTAQGLALLTSAVVAYVLINQPTEWPKHLLTLSMLLAFLLFLSGRLGWLERGPLPFVGRISYSLYLVHQNLGLILIAALTRLGTPDLLAAATATLTCIGLAWVITRLIEVPAKQALLQWARGRPWWQAKRLAPTDAA
jgi:peptidoglycan/LPS O-acetylase OafA/YrhL